jgi:hypothetical protein
MYRSKKQKEKEKKSKKEEQVDEDLISKDPEIRRQQEEKAAYIQSVYRKRNQKTASSKQ